MAERDRVVRKVVQQQIRTMRIESLIPASPVIAGTLRNRRTPNIFYNTGKNTPISVPCLLDLDPLF
jgi:hypothetical protein